jgi:hypothetical protein
MMYSSFVLRIGPAAALACLLAVAPLGAQDSTRAVPRGMRALLREASRPVYVGSGREFREVLDPALVAQVDTGQSLAWRTGDLAFRMDLAGALDSLGPVGYAVPYALGLPALRDDATLRGFLSAYPVVFNDGALSFDATARLFRGTLSVLLHDSTNPGVSTTLERSFQLILRTDADSIVPEELALLHTGFPPERVTVIARHPGDSVTVSIRTAFDPSGFALRFPVHPAAVIETSPRKVQGLGVGTFRVAVAVHGALNGLEPDLQPDISRGHFEAVLDGSEGRAFEYVVRSSGLGTATFRVGAPGLDSDETHFEFGFPWLFFGMGLVGALLGAWAGSYRAPPGKRRRAFVNRLTWGVAGLLAYFVLGVQIFPIDKSVLPISEMAVFTVAFLSAFLLPSLMGRQPSDDVAAPIPGKAI